MLERIFRTGQFCAEYSDASEGLLIYWILRRFADHLCGILKVEHFFAFEERFQGPKEIQ
jgi:hypothetical protein